MFVDIGFEKNAFLHFWDAIPAALDSGVEESSAREPRSRGRSITAKDIPRSIPSGSEMLVQVTKGPIGTKGPRITTEYLAWPGATWCSCPSATRCGISRKIEIPRSASACARSSASSTSPRAWASSCAPSGEGQRARYFVRDLGILVEQWERFEEAMRRSRRRSASSRSPI